MPQIPMYPWYTYTAITLLWLVALGGLWAILRLYFRLFTRALFMIPRLLDLGWMRLFGVSLTSAGTSHWALPREVKQAGLLRGGWAPPGGLAGDRAA
jgi:hypothetical protein